MQIKATYAGVSQPGQDDQASVFQLKRISTFVTPTQARVHALTLDDRVCVDSHLPGGAGMTKRSQGMEMNAYNGAR